MSEHNDDEFDTLCSMWENICRLSDKALGRLESLIRFEMNYRTQIEDIDRSRVRGMFDEDLPDAFVSGYPAAERRLRQA